MDHFRRSEFEGITRADIDLGVATYPVFVGSNPLDAFVSYVTKRLKGTRVAIVADDTTGELFGISLEAAFISRGIEVVALTIPAGESSKSWLVAGQLADALSTAHVERHDVLIALGGGMVSDLAGFVASTYLRGIDFAICSTTLLSMVDACIGGKTAIDLPAGKNLVGTFKQPIAVMADIDTLKNLPNTEFLSGLSEACKTALLDSGEFVAWMIDKSEALQARDTTALVELVLRCMEFKALVVSSDVFETGPRECLNYGHTLGHAIEKCAGYGVVPHGVAVGEGMRFASRLAVEMCGSDAEMFQAQDQFLDLLGIVRIEKEWSAQEIVEAMLADKKVRSGEVRFVFLTSPGSWEVVPVSQETLYQHVRAWLASEA